ncbi:formimidoylglutamase [Thiotrichales bacterium 19X7-9]|nr:formimidoylglutamase [Thiotrichales bacterium 19X7-9]
MTDKQSLWQGRSDITKYEYIYQIVQQLSIDQLKPTSGFGLIGFASDEGIRRNLGRVGAKEGPDALRRALASIALKKEISLYDLGDVLCLDGDLERAQSQLAASVKSIIENGLMPVVLGGGHETAWGHFLGIDQAYTSKEEIAIINFDAHLDLRALIDNKYASSGTPFYQISEYLKSMDRPFHYYCAGVQPFANTKTLFDYANDHQVNIYLAEEINQNPYNLGFIKNIIQKHNKIYVSVCLDVFQAAIAPGVSAPQALGIHLNYVLEALKLLAQSNAVVGIDIVELSPRYDIDCQSAKLAASLLSTFLQT